MLQRKAGNAAVTSLLSSTAVAVQRAPGAAGSATERIKDALDTSAQNVGATTALTIGSQFTDPAVSTSSSLAGGLTGPFGSGIAAGAGLATSVDALRTARRGKDAHPAGTAGHLEAARDLRSARAEVGQNASGLVGNMLNGAGGALNFTGHAPAVYNAVLSAGGAAALPTSVLQTARYARKAAKAQGRVDALHTLMSAEDQEPTEALNAASQQVAARRELLYALDDLYESKSAAYQARVRYVLHFMPLDEPWEKELESLRPALLEVQALQQKLHKAGLQLMEALAKEKQRHAAKAAMERALGEAAQEVERHRTGAPQQISLRMIQAYAVQKNNRGRIKKIIAAMGGAVGTAGSVATLVASIAVAAGATAGAGVLLATPIGWGLAAAASVAGLGLASYKSWKYFAKRWEHTGRPDAGGPALARIGQTLAFWRKAGPSKREEYASALYGMAEGGPNADRARTQEARKTIAALGLDWDELNMRDEPASARRLIAAKLAS